jgi:hypothetical protein
MDAPNDQEGMRFHHRAENMRAVNCDFLFTPLLISSTKEESFDLIAVMTYQFH